MIKKTGGAFEYIHEEMKKRITWHSVEEMMKKIIVTMIRPRLECAAVSWNPSTKKCTKKLERIQTAATKLVPALENYI